MSWIARRIEDRVSPSSSSLARVCPPIRRLVSHAPPRRRTPTTCRCVCSVVFHSTPHYGNWPLTAAVCSRYSSVTCSLPP